jgi:hypothetical protein
MPPCVLCNGTAAEVVSLVVDETDADVPVSEMVLCERCQGDLLAEPWIHRDETSAKNSPENKIAK